MTYEEKKHNFTSEKTIELPIAWIKRLKVYKDKIESTSVNDPRHHLEVVSLLGYLDSLDMYL